MARWTFREYNELPHMLDRRLAPSYKHAEEYLGLFSQSEIVSAVARVCGFVSGSLIAVLFLFAAIDESILLHVKVADQNLLWYVGVLGIAFGASKGLLPDEKLHSTSHTLNLVEEAEDKLMQVSSFTHYYPQKWRKKAFKQEVKTEFESFFVFKVHAFILEIFSVVCAPLVLMVR